jgi:uncharacterized protein (DUF1330 family)
MIHVGSRRWLCQQEGISQSVREDTMETKYKLAIALVAGAALGGGAIQQLQAQMKPPTYVVVAIRKITDAEAYKAVLEKAPAAAMAAGGNFVIRTDKITSLDGTPPARFVLIKFDSIETSTSLAQLSGPEGG